MSDTLAPLRKAKQQAIKQHGMFSPQASEAGRKLDEEWQRLHTDQADSDNPAGTSDNRRRRAEQALAPITRPGAGAKDYHGMPLSVQSVAVKPLDDEDVERESANTQHFQITLGEPEQRDVALPQLPDADNQASRLARICVGVDDMAEVPSLGQINRERNHNLLALFD